MFLNSHSDFTSGDDQILLRCGETAARIAGALAHELNNPLQGVFSRIAALERDVVADQDTALHVEQVRLGLQRIAHIVGVLAVYYENLPRPLDRTTVRLMGESWIAAFQERRLDAELDSAIAWDTMILCLAPELVRLVTEAFAAPESTGRLHRVFFDREQDRVVVTCEAGANQLADSEPWQRLDPVSQASGLYVLIDEMAHLSQGKAEFRFGPHGLRGIRLQLRTQMS